MDLGFGLVHRVLQSLCTRSGATSVHVRFDSSYSVTKVHRMALNCVPGYLFGQNCDNAYLASATGTPLPCLLLKPSFPILPRQPEQVRELPFSPPSSPLALPSLRSLPHSIPPPRWRGIRSGAVTPRSSIILRYLTKSSSSPSSRRPDRPKLR